jgi:hypothetical protein
MLEHYNVSKMIEGIDLERRTLRDWVKKLISHLGGQKPCGEDEGWCSTEEKHPREDASHALEHLIHQRGGLR